MHQRVQRTDRDTYIQLKLGGTQRDPTKEKIKDLWEMRATVKETQVQWVRRGLLAHGQEKR